MFQQTLHQLRIVTSLGVTALALTACITISPEPPGPVGPSSLPPSITPSTKPTPAPITPSNSPNTPGGGGVDSDPSKVTGTTNALVGSWQGWTLLGGTTSPVGTLVIRDNGTYQYSGGEGGTYTLTAIGANFKGALEATGGGVAYLDRGALKVGVFVFNKVGGTSSTNATQSSTNTSSSSTASQTTVNLVEPILNGPKLSASRTEVIEQFNATEGISSVENDDFMAYMTTRISSFVIRSRSKLVSPECNGCAVMPPSEFKTIPSRAKLACGVGIGTSKSDVQRLLGASRALTTGQYSLSITYDSADTVSEIRITPANGAVFAP